MLTVNKDDMTKYIGKRKHSSHMTDSEISSLFARLKSVEGNNLKWRVAGHALDRLEQKGIKADYYDIVSTIHNANIIEYKIDRSRYHKDPDERVVLRSKAVVNRLYNLNVVYSLTGRRIITVWINKVNDRHDTLDWNIYDENMPVFNV